MWQMVQRMFKSCYYWLFKYNPRWWKLLQKSWRIQAAAMVLCWCSRTPMLKCDFKNVALQRYWNRTSAWLFSCKFAAYFQNTFSQEHLWTAASYSSYWTEENVRIMFGWNLQIPENALNPLAFFLESYF